MNEISSLTGVGPFSGLHFRHIIKRLNKNKMNKIILSILGAAIVLTGYTALNRLGTVIPVQQAQDNVQNYDSGNAIHSGSATRHPGICDPNYSGCVPVASDVDCMGGGGDGPVYIKGPVMVYGKDIYGLDRDHDGIGCE
jgi:hypothetical protein